MKQKYIIEFKTGSLKYETYLLVSIFEFYFSAKKRNRKDARINVFGTFGDFPQVYSVYPNLGIESPAYSRCNDERGKVVRAGNK